MHTGFDVHKDILAPQLVDYLAATHQQAPPLDQHDQQVHRLPLEPASAPVPAQLVGCDVELEVAEPVAQRHTALSVSASGNQQGFPSRAPWPTTGPDAKDSASPFPRRPRDDPNYFDTVPDGGTSDTVKRPGGPCSGARGRVARAGDATQLCDPGPAGPSGPRTRLVPPWRNHQRIGWRRHVRPGPTQPRTRRVGQEERA